jgi:hypothetical protein
MGCLDKSKLDWEQFVEQEGIKEELTTFNKGKHGYVNFLLYVSASPLISFRFVFSDTSSHGLINYLQAYRHQSKMSSSKKMDL